MLEFFAPAAHIPRLPAEKIPSLYRWMRWRILSTTFFGYAIFYIVRNNLPPVSKEMGAALCYDKSMMGTILAATALAYGIGKLIMGSVSDRSNPRVFMSFSLVLTAGLNFIFSASHSYYIHLFLWTLNGFVQGGGWGPCGRSMGHWFSLRERGTVFAFWNISHNAGGATAGILTAYVAQSWGWQSAFYVPGIIAMISAVILYFGLVDTPQSEGLPPIEDYKNDHAETNEEHEIELSTKELYVKYILNNKYLWLFAIANFFVYITRYSMLTWGPTYLKEVKGATLLDGGTSTMFIELSGIPSTLLIGWISDKCSGRRGMVSLLCMIPIFFAFLGIMLNPPGHLWIDMALLGIVGFFVYPPVMLLGVAALDLTSKKAVGTAAGFVGLFGYIGSMVQAQGIGYLAQNYGWPSVFYAILGCTVMAIIILSFTWKIKPRS
ncbi:MAG: MFS transporter [Candidatus Riflebacteria bacterium]|nr:MFS transporter [Candidatus Riflebacteria bacterium]